VDKSPRLDVNPTDYGYNYVSTRQMGGGDTYVRLYHYVMPFQQMRGGIHEFSGARRKSPALDGHIWAPIDDTTTYVYNWHHTYDDTTPVDQAHRDALLSLGVPADAVQVTGSVKFDGALASQTSQAEALKQLLGIRANQTILVAGSTQECEEKHLLSAWKRLVPDYPDLRLILVPRHPERFESVAQWLASEQVTFSRRSQLVQPANIPAGVVLLDTLGELSALWTLADLGFVGGSLDGKRGGQSMIEPAARGVPACFGPHIWNFKDISKQLVARGGATILSGPADLEPTLRQWLANPADRQRMGQAARAFVATQQGATQRTLDFLEQRLPILANSGRRAG
jgi:3-deoxy-D-manno-octulosonic-acid transferase